MNKPLALAALLGALVGCSANRVALTASDAANALPGELLLEVLNGTDTSLFVENAIVLVFDKDMSLKEIGRTNTFGEVRLKKSDLASSSTPILVVCKTPPFGCAAEPFQPLGLLDYDEFVIALPPRVVH
jgi:hypothetical protein